MSEQDYEGMSDSEKKKEDWMNAKWRPMMGWMYMVVCMMDFVAFPVLWSLVQAYAHGQVNSQWQPLTLQGAGLFHLAMGAIIGVSAFGRTQEKLAGANNGGLNLPANVGTTYQPPGSVPQPAAGGFGSPAAGGFGATSSGFGSAPAASGFGAPSSGGFGSSAPASNSGFGGGGFGSTPAPATGFGSTAPAAAPVTGQVTAGFGGKPAPVFGPDPIL